MYLDIEVYLSEYLQSGQVYHEVCLYGTTAGHGAGADTNISICNRWRRNPGLDVTDRDKRITRQTNVSIYNIWDPNPRLTVTDQDERRALRLISQTVTTRGQKPFYLLQIKTKEMSNLNISICNNNSAKTGLTVTDLDIRNQLTGLSKSVTSRPQNGP